MNQELAKYRVLGCDTVLFCTNLPTLNINSASTFRVFLYLKRQSVLPTRHKFKSRIHGVNTGCAAIYTFTDVRTEKLTNQKYIYINIYSTFLPYDYYGD
jgi:hypothetical protein